MNEIKRGLFQDHYKNGEPKTQEEINKDYALIANWVGAFFIILFIGFVFGAIFGVIK